LHDLKVYSSLETLHWRLLKQPFFDFKTLEKTAYQMIIIKYLFNLQKIRKKYFFEVILVHV
jgi:hypothetical protein